MSIGLYIKLKRNMRVEDILENEIALDGSESSDVLSRRAQAQQAPALATADFDDVERDTGSDPAFLYKPTAGNPGSSYFGQTPDDQEEVAKIKWKRF